MLSFSPLLHSNAIPKFLRAFTLCFFILFSATNSSIAQNEPDTARHEFTALKFEIGISGGLSVNSFTRGQPQTGTNTGYAAGLSLNYRVYRQWSIQVEANFLQQGGQLLSFKDDTKLGLPESFTTKNVKNSSVHLNSLDIPLLIKYTIPLKKDWKPAFYIGGSYAYNFNVVENYQKTGNLLPGEDVIATVSDSENVTSQYSRDRLNLIVGADLQLALFNKVKLLLDFRYVSGVTPAREHYSYMEKIGFGTNIRSNSFVSKLGFIIPIQ
ncbi:MAG: PorT family protein [Pedobacter sp.]|nr:MAG: PorT family protein [Pedobacter sp.]